MSATKSRAEIDGILAAIPHKARGPGGSAAVIKDGEVVSQLSWGYANLEQRVPMSATTVLPICSISKQMVCLAMTSLCRNPTPAMLMKDQSPWEQMTAEMKRLLPHLDGHPDGDLRLEHLFNMQSGIRDYWVMTTLYGAFPEQAFSITSDAPKALDLTRSFHFKPGSEYSYSNVNFFVLGRILENVSGQSLSQVLSERVFVPAGMTTASLYINTQGIPLPIVGYEGTEELGYFPAVNRIEWAGDAGIGASLADMIAYEKYLQRSYSDASSLYHHNSQQQKFSDGTPAGYGFGLARVKVAGKEAIGHGGALRGFRLQRVHMPSEQLSVIIMLNFENAKGSIVEDLFKDVLGHKDTEPSTHITAAAEWEGSYLDEASQLHTSVRTVADKPGKVLIDYNRAEETFDLTSANQAECKQGEATIEDHILSIKRIDDNRVARARRLTKANEEAVTNVKGADYTGVYRCEESESTFHCTGEKGTLYGAFDGFLGKGPVWLMRYIGEDVWILSCPRGMDASPPGDWTLIFRRSGGAVTGVTIGCFLGRKVEFKKQS